MFKSKLPDQGENQPVEFDDISLESLGGHLLFGDIDVETVRGAITFILKASHLGNASDAITFFINTGGGSCADGFALIDVMTVSRLKIQTVGMGTVASMGVLIAAAGTKGSRIMTRNTEVMAHQFSGYYEGKFHELMAASKANAYLEHQFVEHFKRHSSMNEKTIRDVMFGPSDRWLTPAECKKYGLVDTIVDELPDFSAPIITTAAAVAAAPLTKSKRRAQK